MFINFIVPLKNVFHSMFSVQQKFLRWSQFVFFLILALRNLQHLICTYGLGARVSIQCYSRRTYPDVNGKMFCKSMSRILRREQVNETSSFIQIEGCALVERIAGTFSAQHSPSSQIPTSSHHDSLARWLYTCDVVAMKKTLPHCQSFERVWHLQHEEEQQRRATPSLEQGTETTSDMDADQSSQHSKTFASPSHLIRMTPIPNPTRPAGGNRPPRNLPRRSSRSPSNQVLRAQAFFSSWARRWASSDPNLAFVCGWTADKIEERGIANPRPTRRLPPRDGVCGCSPRPQWPRVEGYRRMHLILDWTETPGRRNQAARAGDLLRGEPAAYRDHRFSEFRNMGPGRWRRAMDRYRH